MKYLINKCDISGINKFLIECIVIVEMVIFVIDNSCFLLII